MRRRVVICADHNIGFKIVNYILKTNSKYFDIIDIYTTETNNEGFWKPIKNIFYLNRTIKIFKSNEEFLSDIREKNIDYIFLLSWKYLISKEIINIVNIGIINLHYSLLPKYRGVYPVNNAIINGEKETGITFHWVNEQIDSGNIILQNNLKIKLTETTDLLLQRLDKLAFKEFKRIWLSRKELIRKNIDKHVITEYFSREYFESKNELNLSKKYSVLELINLIRGKNFKNKSSIFFLDENNEKVFVHIKLKK